MWQGLQLALLHFPAPQAWVRRSSHEKRAILFVVVFVLLVLASASPLFGGNSNAPAHQFHQGIAAHWGHIGAAGALRAAREFSVVAVADNDQRNVATNGDSGARMSALARGTLRIHVGDGQQRAYTVTWQPSVTHIEGHLVRDGRGMELSTLQYWKNGRLYSCDDHTGIVYELVVTDADAKAIPRHILADGNGQAVSGMRCEWSAVKGDLLYFGSAGEPWIAATPGASAAPGATAAEPSFHVVHRNGLWVKTVSPAGDVKHLDWGPFYDRIRRALGSLATTDPRATAGAAANAGPAPAGDDALPTRGYVMHECALWSHTRRQWIFVPRHVSSSPYRPNDEKRHGSSVMVTADAELRNMRVVPLPSMKHPPATHGVTECKFLPNGRDAEILLLRVGDKANGGGYESVATIVSPDGALLMDDVSLPAGWKFEGLEVRPIVTPSAFQG